MLRKIYENIFNTKGEFHLNCTCNLQICEYDDGTGDTVAFALELLGPEDGSIVSPCRDLFLELRKKCDIGFEKLIWMAPPPRLRIFDTHIKRSTWFEIVNSDGSPHRKPKRD